MTKKKTAFDSLSKALRDLGIQNTCQLYISGTADESIVVSLNSTRKALHLKGQAKSVNSVKLIAGSKEHRQALLEVNEPPRVTDIFTHIEFKGKQPTQKDIEKAFANAHSQQVPGTTYNVRSTQYKEVSSFSKNVTYNITAISPGSSNQLLVGYDEEHMFISMLPHKVKSIKAAHAVLMPNAAKGKKYKRQGEFFFVPCSEKEIASLYKELTKFSGPTYDHMIGVPLEKENGDESDHVVSMMIQDNHTGEQYVMGNVAHDRHKTLVLAKWHRVYCNNEVPNSNDGMNWD